MSDKLPIVVVLGIDVDGRPHASRFEERDASFVVRADVAWSPDAEPIGGYLGAGEAF